MCNLYEGSAPTSLRLRCGISTPWKKCEIMGSPWSLHMNTDTHAVTVSVLPSFSKSDLLCSRAQCLAAHE